MKRKVFFLSLALIIGGMGLSGCSSETPTSPPPLPEEPPPAGEGGGSSGTEDAPTPPPPPPPPPPQDIDPDDFDDLSAEQFCSVGACKTNGSKRERCMVSVSICLQENTEDPADCGTLALLTCSRGIG